MLDHVVYVSISLLAFPDLKCTFVPKDVSKVCPWTSQDFAFYISSDDSDSEDEIGARRKKKKVTTAGSDDEFGAKESGSEGGGTPAGDDGGADLGMY